MKDRFCECGCGLLVPQTNPSYISRFIKGHWRPSEEHKRKISLANSGKKLTRKHKKKLSLANIKYEGLDNKDRRLKKTYGITFQDFDKILESQGGVCAICGTIGIYRKRKRMSIDHDHKTGKVRGILCNACNMGLGNFKDNPDNCLKASEYLRKYK